MQQRETARRQICAESRRNSEEEDEEKNDQTYVNCRMNLQQYLSHDRQHQRPQESALVMQRLHLERESEGQKSVKRAHAQD
jgi:hypothetical protein